MSPEHRKSPRVPVHYPAVIEIAEGKVRPCMLTDASERGARLTLAVSDDLPETFYLRLSRRGQRSRKCKIVWRANDQVGIEYLKDEPLKLEGFSWVKFRPPQK